MTTHRLLEAPGHAAPIPVFLQPGALLPAAGDVDPLTAAARRQAHALAAVRVSDPGAWLFGQRARYVAGGTCDPYAQLMLARAGFLPAR